MGFFDRFRRKSLSPVLNSGGGWVPVSEPSMGAWQKNQELQRTDLISFHAVFSCTSLISSDIGKLNFLTKMPKNGVLQQAAHPVNDLIKTPNTFQNQQQFFENWVSSKVLRGNTYVLKMRDIFGDIYRLLVLNPDRVKPLISDVGEVFYQISSDKLFNLSTDLIVPASEIIHDRYNCFYHPLVGLSPITACAMSVGQGLSIQSNSTAFFNNMSRPSGILSSPNAVSKDKAKEIRDRWNENYSGGKLGQTAVIGDGMTYQQISIASSDAQLIEQLKMTTEIVCSVFHVPSFKVGVGAIPGGQKISDLNEIYYSDCLQHYIEAIENLLTQHLEVDQGYVVEADIKALIRMDGSSQMSYLVEGVKGGIFAPDEARAEVGLQPVEGGSSPLMQQQNYSLAALAKRDARDDPFSTSTPSPAPVASKSSSDPQTTFLSMYAGIFDPKKHYKTGSFVTKSGALWHCDSDSIGDFDHQKFTLVVKKGAANDLG
jgi:HK97 family phage portal protein